MDTFIFFFLFSVTKLGRRVSRGKLSKFSSKVDFSNIKNWVSISIDVELSSIDIGAF